MIRAILKVDVLLFGSLAIVMCALGLMAMRDGEGLDAALGFLLCALWLVEMFRTIKALPERGGK